MNIQTAIEIKRPDGQTVTLEPRDENTTEILGTDLAKKIKKDLDGAPLVLRVNGVLKDLNTPLKNNDTAEVLTFADPAGRHTFWHSSAHILAQAVKRIYPDAKPTIGPAIEEGFFYDFADLSISEEDFAKIEAEVQNIIKERITPERIEYKNEAEAKKDFGDNPFKSEIIAAKEETLSAYRQGDFVDLCTGPHIPNTSVVQGFKLLKTSGAYWRGDAQNQQLTRLYGISFPDKKMLKEYLHRVEEAKKRDHRVVGRKLDLFSFQEEAPGMPFFHPKGMAVRDELIRFLGELHKQDGYVEIKTPVMLSQELWETSGHWDYYRDNMYTSEVENREFAIKPMNCPGCMLYYRNSQYSYRQLPLKVAEIGHVHRHEMSGALSGLFRVRSFHQDDAHIFMEREQIKQQILGVLKLADTVYSTFGLTYHLELSTRPEKAIGTDEMWEMATDGLRSALDELKNQTGRGYKLNAGDGAFYGPKIDFHIKDAIGRTWQCGTIQLDMFLPERFDLLYDGRDGAKHRPIMIHRAIYGSIERFMGILIEHYTGRFPLWLSPVQIAFLSVADRHADHAWTIAKQFQTAGFRISVDDSSEGVPKKVRNAQIEQANYIAVIGDQEIESGKLTIRTRAGDVLGERSAEEIQKAMRTEYDTRSPDPLLK